jgi:hypothetical protein
MSAHTHATPPAYAWRQPAADSVFDEIEALYSRRTQVEQSLNKTASRRQKRRYRRDLHDIDRQLDERELECEALKRTMDEEWEGLAL